MSQGISDSKSPGGTSLRNKNYSSVLDPGRRVAEFQRFRALFKQKREKLLGTPTPETLWSYFTSKTKFGKRLLNFIKPFPDMIYRIDSWGKIESLKRANVRITIIAREVFISEASPFKELFEISKNKKILETFLTREPYAEVNCEKFIVLEGLTLAQFHVWVRKLNHSPFSFWSDDRGENAGRASIDNEWPSDDKHPLMETPLSPTDLQKEKELWQPVFPSLRWLYYFNEWYISRTHVVIYRVRDKQGRDVILLPVHIDPKNAVMVIGDLVHRVIGKRPRGKNALTYHKMEVGRESYVGTGLYDLGIKNLLRLLEMRKDQFGHLEIIGREKIQTTGTIIGDDRINSQIEKLMKKNQ